jgi:hypothetical protein
MRFSSSRETGSALLIVLVTVGIIGVLMASYLNLVSSQNLSTMRSLQWNSAIPIAEAGIEEALTHLYYNPTNRATEGWTLTGDYYQKERHLGDARYITRISTGSPPVIFSSAYVRAVFKTNYIDPPRTVYVTTTNESLFVRGMVAKGAIDMSGNNVRTDSFDSADPAYSTGGQYDPAKAKDGGSVATNSSLTNSFSVGNADIHGHAAMGPTGTPSIGAGGGIGPKWWRDAGNNGIYTNWFTDDMNVSFPDVQLPFSGGAFTPSSGTVGGTNYDYVLGTGNYQLSSLSMSGNSGTVMLIQGNAVLLVTGNVSFSGSASIRIAPGAQLKMYVSGSSTSLGGNGVVNDNANATNFFYYGLPGNTSLSLSGNAGFTGVIYAPSAALTLGGGGNNTVDFIGASVSGTVKMNGHFNFHYDENLGRLQTGRGYIVTSWQEL